jgi:glycosyltransferase involved in cell wall biosynthesis
VWVITEKERFEAEVRAELQRRPTLHDRIHFHFVQRHRHPVLQRIWPPSYYWSYRQWQKDAFTLAQRLHAQVGFDVAHQLNMVGFREPGYLWRLDVPFVWGPIGGTGLMPWRFLATLGPIGALHHIARNLLNALHLRLMPRPRHAARQAQGRLIAATSGTADALRRFFGVQARVICEVGSSQREPGAVNARAPDEPLRLVWSGLHEPRKALPLLLRALPQLPADVRWQLDILGNGPCTKAWQRLAKRLRIDRSCTWHGWVARERAASVMANAHTMVITSLLDLTSSVLVEALALALPVLCLDHCGFADMVTPECGVKVAVRSPRQVAAHLAEAIAVMWHDEPRRRRLAQGSLRRAQAVSWEGKADALTAIYHEAVQQNACRERVNPPLISRSTA